MTTKHVPVLLNEVLSHLHLKPGREVVDATLGGGGYTEAFLERVIPGGTVTAIDRDAGALRHAKKRFGKFLESGELVLAHGNFADVATIVPEGKRSHIDAVVADLGISSDQLDDPSRGLSFLKDGPLDMRLNMNDELTAREIVSEWSEEDIAKTLRENAEERYAHGIARAIVRSRSGAEIKTTKELAKIVETGVPGQYRRKKIHPATKTFMAIRMAVNGEMESLGRFLEGSLEILKSGGYLAVVTFHSGEDRKVKEFFRRNARGCTCPKDFPVCRCGGVQRLELVTRKVVAPSEEECARNPRARSAKLRVAKKVGW